MAKTGAKARDRKNSNDFSTVISIVQCEDACARWVLRRKMARDECERHCANS
jgi:hypothetical protein